MSVGLGLDFDPYLPCNSHHVYRTPTSTPNSGISSSQTTRTVPTTATATQRQTGKYVFNLPIIVKKENRKY